MIIPKKWIPKQRINLNTRINLIIAEIHRNPTPWKLYSTTRSRARYKRSGRLAGGTRKAMAFIERALPRRKSGERDL
ncbi:MAG: hypothetical protein RL768_2959 [Nitrospirota bacterium]|jgi:hypothetical protein